MSAEAWKWVLDLDLKAGGREGASRERAAVAVLAVYAHHADDNDIASPALAYVAAFTRRSPRTVSRILDDLRAAGLLELVHRSAPGRSAVYRLRLDVTAASIGEHRPPKAGHRSPVQRSPAIDGNRSPVQRSPNSHERSPNSHERSPAMGGTPQGPQGPQRARPEKSNGQRHPTEAELRALAREKAASRNPRNPEALTAKILDEDRDELVREANRRRAAEAEAAARGACKLCDDQGLRDRLHDGAVVGRGEGDYREPCDHRCPRCGLADGRHAAWCDGAATMTDQVPTRAPEGAPGPR